MKLRSLVVSVAIALAAVASHAQTGLYLNPVAMRISNSTPDHGTFAFLGQNATSRMFYGVDFGAYYDFKTPYPFKAGLDIHDSVLHGGGASLNNFLVGIRFSGRPFRNEAWKLYVEPEVGSGRSEAPSTTVHVSKVEYGGYAGLDYETKHHIDFRVVQLGYSGLLTASSGTIGGSASIPSASILTVSAGFVFRFP